MKKVQKICLVGMLLFSLTGCALGGDGDAVETSENSKSPLGKGVHVTILENMIYEEDEGELASVSQIFEDISHTLFYDGEPNLNIFTSGFQNYGVDESDWQQEEVEKETLSDVKESVKNSDYVFLLGCQQYKSDFSDLKEIIDATKSDATIVALGYEGVFGYYQYDEDYLKEQERIVYVDMKRILEKMSDAEIIDISDILVDDDIGYVFMNTKGGFFYALAAYYCICPELLDLDFGKMVSRYNGKEPYEDLTRDEVQQMSVDILPYVKEELMLVKRGETKRRLAATKEYEETRMPYDVVGFCEGGLWESALDETGKPYAIEWDSSDELDTEYATVHKKTWDGKKQRDEVLNLPNEILTYITNGDDNREAVLLPNGKFAAIGTKDFKNNKIFVSDLRGNLLHEVLIKDVEKMIQVPEEYSGSYVQILDDTYFAVIWYDDYEEIFTEYVGIYDMENKKVIKEYEINGSMVAKYDDYLIVDKGGTAGYERVVWKTGETMPETILGNPDYERSLLEYSSSETYEVDATSEGIYVLTGNGLSQYSYETKSWNKLMDKKQSSILKDVYGVTDLTVVNDKEFYITSVEGGDDEVASDFTKYTEK